MTINKYYIAIAGLIVLIVTILLVFLFPNTLRRNGGSPIPTPFQSQSGESEFEEPTVIQDVQVVKALPANNANLLPVQEIALTFSAPMNPRNVQIKVEPQTETSIRLSESDEKTILISPVTAWSEGSTQITILPSTKSLNFVPVKSSYTYTFTAKFPENPPGSFDDY